MGVEAASGLPLLTFLNNGSHANILDFLGIKRSFCKKTLQGKTSEVLRDIVFKSRVIHQEGCTYACKVTAECSEQCYAVHLISLQKYDQPSTKTVLLAARRLTVENLLIL